MNKYVYLFELRKELSFMTPDDKESAVRFYEELFADAGAENEKRTIEELGTPARLAYEIRREYEDGVSELSGRELSTLDDSRGGTDTDTDGGSTSGMGGGVTDDDGTGRQTHNDGADGGANNGTWQGRHWTGPNPPWRENESYSADDAGGTQERDGGGTDGRYGQSESRYNQAGGQYGRSEPGDDWQDRRYVWSRKASEWGARAGHKAGEWGAKAGEKAEEWGRKAGEWGEKAGYKAGEWSQKAEETAGSWTQDAKKWWYGTRDDGTAGGGDHNGFHRSARGRLPAWAVVLIAVFTAPLWLPLISAAVGLIFAAFATVFGLFIGGVGTGIGLIVGGVASILKGVFTFYRFGDALVCIGSGLLMIAIGIPLVAVSVWAFRKIWKAMTRGLSNLWSRIRGRRPRGYEEKE